MSGGILATLTWSVAIGAIGSLVGILIGYTIDRIEARAVEARAVEARPERLPLPAMTGRLPLLVLEAGVHQVTETFNQVSLPKPGKSEPETLSVLNIIECPVCLQIPESSPIFQCRDNGHVVCKICKPKLNEICPECR